MGKEIIDTKLGRIWYIEQPSKVDKPKIALFDPASNLPSGILLFIEIDKTYITRILYNINVYQSKTIEKVDTLA